VFFTSNYTDESTREGYQFEFHCDRCGNGYASTFRKSVAGFGGRLLAMGGDLIGGDIGERASALGEDAEAMRDSSRGSTHDKHLREAVEEMRQHFVQCGRCARWVCRQVCWNQRGVCGTCAHELDHAMPPQAMPPQAMPPQVMPMPPVSMPPMPPSMAPPMPPAAPVAPAVRAVGTVYGSARVAPAAPVAACPSCGRDSGGGQFCQSCGTPLTASAPQPPAASTFCRNCGSQLAGQPFCGRCGAPAG
jgi:hypothetical protein